MNKITTDKFLTFPLLFSALIIIGLTVGLYILFPELPPQMPLYYSLPWGNSQLVPKLQFFLIPGLIILLTVINFVLAYYLHQVHRILRRLLMVNLALINLIFLFTVIKILSIFL